MNVKKDITECDVHWPMVPDYGWCGEFKLRKQTVSPIPKEPDE